MAALTVGTAAYGFVIEPLFRLIVKEYTVTTAAWPKDSPPLRIAALADFHVGRPWMTPRRIRSIAKTAMRQNPDLIVCLGDYMQGVSDDWTTGPVPAIGEWMAALGTLSAPLGVFAILGNHDVEFDAIRAGFASVNIPLLENTAAKIGCSNYDFWIAGLGDRWQLRDDFATAITAVTDSQPVILLAHEPDAFVNIAAAERHVLLTLSGDTHGGQVNVPFLTSLYTGERPYLYGHYTKNDRHLIVSGGLGCTRVPVRFMRPPEITVVNVRGAA